MMILRMMMNLEVRPASAHTLNMNILLPFSVYSRTMGPHVTVLVCFMVQGRVD